MPGISKNSTGGRSDWIHSTTNYSIPSKDVPYINNFDIVLISFFLFLSIKKWRSLFGLDSTKLHHSIFYLIYIKIGILESFIF